MNSRKAKTKKTALVTGATGGIGHLLCRCFAQDNIDLVLVARDLQKLQQISTRLSDEFGIGIQIIRSDLAIPNAAQTVFQKLKDKDLRIDFLINNAGIGYYGAVAESDLNQAVEMINLNIATLVQLTQLLLPDMLQQGTGRILNVASLAGFQPGGPNAAVYYASKGFVLAFSRALTLELKHSPATCTVFCPSPLDTPFAMQGGFTATRLYRYFSDKPDQQVRKAYRAFLKGKPTVVPGFVNKLLAIGGEFPPRSIALALNNFLLQK